LTSPSFSRRSTLGPRPRRLALSLAVLGALAFAQLAYAEVSEDEKETSAEAPARPAHMPLSPLPEPPSLALEKSRPEAARAIRRLLGELSSPDQNVRETAVRQLLEAKIDWVFGLSQELDRLAEQGGRPEMAKRLDELRRAKKKKGADSTELEDGTRDDGASDDGVLERVLKLDNPSRATKNLAELLAVARMLEAIRTTAAARELIRIYVRFGEFVRPSVQRHLDALGDKALGALIEARKHPAENVARWAARQLDMRGKSIVHELVRTEDPDALADILVALGRVGDSDAAPVLISYSSTERATLRLAARQGIALLGESAAWQLRDAYLDTTGRRAPREWTWKRTARELFTEFDRLRQAGVQEAFEAGLEAETRGDFALMKSKFDEVLLHNPLFESRDKMAKGYLAYARAHVDSDRSESLVALRRVERLGSREERQQAKSLRYALEAEDLAARGIYDLGLLNESVALDPQNDRAEALLKKRSKQQGWPQLARYGAAGVVLLIGLLGALRSLGFTLRARGGQKEPLPNPDALSPTDSPEPEAPNEGPHEPPLEAAPIEREPAPGDDQARAIDGD
jgi:hypothetical protein